MPSRYTFVVAAAVSKRMSRSSGCVGARGMNPDAPQRWSGTSRVFECGRQLYSVTINHSTMLLELLELLEGERHRSDRPAVRAVRYVPG